MPTPITSKPAAQPASVVGSEVESSAPAPAPAPISIVWD